MARLRDTFHIALCDDTRNPPAPSLLLAAAPKWVGRKACQACHREIFDAYPQTPMALSSGPVGTGLLAESFAHAEITHSPSGYRYRIARTKGRYTIDLESTRAAPPFPSSSAPAPSPVE